MKKKIIFLSLLISCYCFGQQDTLYNIKVLTPGTILNYVNINSINSITELTITGLLNKTDIDAIKRLKSLKKLDISNASIQYNKDALNEAVKTVQSKVEMVLSLTPLVLNRALTPNELQKIKVSSEKEIAEITTKYKSNVMLDDELFKDFVNFELLYLPTKIEKIGKNTFYGCANLTIVCYIYS
jgi:hypothetical protein